jgi:regulatory protein
VPRPTHTSDRSARQPRPLDAAGLDALALFYVGRYATTAKKLEDYLLRKLQQRGWAGEAPADPARLIARLVELRYIDDGAFAEQRGAALARRGYGRRRIDAALRAAGIDEADREQARPDEDAAWAAALTLARRRRIGPFGPPPADRTAREKAIAILMRGGHDIDIARRIVALTEQDVKDQE